MSSAVCVIFVIIYSVYFGINKVCFEPNVSVVQRLDWTTTERRHRLIYIYLKKVAQSKFNYNLIMLIYCSLFQISTKIKYKLTY